MRAREVYTVLALATLAILGALGCGQSPTSPATEGREPARGTAIIALKFTQGLGIDLDRVEVIAVGADMPEQRFDIQLDRGLATGLVELPVGEDRTLTVNAYDATGDLLYTGSGQTDIIGGGQVRLEVTLEPLRSVPKRLVFTGVGQGASERFALKGQVPYTLNIEYSQSITVDLVDELTGDSVERLWQEVGDASRVSVATRAFHLQARGSFFLYIRDTSKAWFIEIEAEADGS